MCCKLGIVIGSKNSLGSYSIFCIYLSFENQKRQMFNDNLKVARLIKTLIFCLRNLRFEFSYGHYRFAQLLPLGLSDYSLSDLIGLGRDTALSKKEKKNV